MLRSPSAPPPSSTPRVSPRWRRALVAAALLATAAGVTPACDRSTSTETPHPPAAEATPAPTSNHPVDRLLEPAWEAAGVTPAPLAGDATFMRRAYLDLTGVVPTAEQAKRFLASDDPNRRAALVDELLSSERYAKHWTNYWNDVLIAGGKKRLVDRVAFRQWLHDQLSKNVPYDEMVRSLITASGVNSEGGRPSPEGWELNEKAPDGVNGAVNFMLTGAQEPQNLAGTTSRVFLAQQIQCAECHDHPTEKWKQEDFQKFTSAFMQVQGKPVVRGRQMGIRRIEVRDVGENHRFVRRRMKKTGYGDKPPTALDGTPLGKEAPRRALAEWMTSPRNPWFAKAIVNRMWGHFLGRGFVEPVDDMSTINMPAAPEVLDALTNELIDSGFDLHHLMRLICTSSAYQRSARGPAELWGSFALRPMNDTQLLDSLVVATGIEPIIEDVAGERLSRVKVNLRRQFRYAFDVDEEASADTFTGTTPQALMLLNGALTTAGSSALDGSTLGEAARLSGGPQATIEHLYLATLSRRPDKGELEHWTGYVAGAAEHYDGRRRRPRGGGPVGKIYRRKRLRDLQPADVAYEDMLWTLLNASEFFFIH